MANILNGIRVLDLSRVYSGPHCALLLSDLGAEVIKIEEPKAGDDSRTLPPYYQGQPYFFVENNRGKKGITLDLRTEKGRDILLKLAGKSDVLLENFTPGVMDRFGLDYARLREVNPRIIYASISGFGQTGPYRSLMAYDMVVTAISGFMSLTGEPERPPVRMNVAVADFTASLYATIAILAALMHVRETGRGQYLDVSMFDGMWDMISSVGLPRYIAKNEVLTRTGNESPVFAPHGLYEAKDGYINITSVSNAQWYCLLKVLGREDLREDPRYASSSLRRKCKEEIDIMLEAWLEPRTVNEAMMELQSAGVPAAAVLALDQVIDSPHVEARELIVEVDQPGAGRMKVPGFPFKMSETPVEIAAGAPSLGQHNAEIYGGLLGMSEDDLAQLKDEGVV